MNKIILDLRHVSDRNELYDLLESAFMFPSYFGRNLDALYDLLTDLSEDTCVGLFLPDCVDTNQATDRQMPENSLFFYLPKLLGTFLDAESANRHLCVISLPPQK